MANKDKYLPPKCVHPKAFAREKPLRNEGAPAPLVSVSLTPAIHCLIRDLLKSVEFNGIEAKPELTTWPYLPEGRLG